MRGKENLATLSRFLPWARVESPLATVYWTHANIHGNEGPPWEATPSSRAFFVLVGGVRVLEISRRKGEDLWEKFSFDPLRCSYHRQRFLNWFLCLAKSSSTLGKRTIPRSFGSVLIRMFIRKLLELHFNSVELIIVIIWTPFETFESWIWQCYPSCENLQTLILWSCL